jgi:HEAT repeat protein
MGHAAAMSQLVNRMRKASDGIKAMNAISIIHRLICGVLLFQLAGCEERVVAKKEERILIKKEDKMDAAAQKHVTQLLEGIHSPNAEIRMSSVIALGEVGSLGDQSDIVINELILLLSDDIRPRSEEEWPRSVGSEAAYALAKIGRKSIPSLLEALHDKEGSVRNHAVIALGEIRDPYAVVGLSNTLANDSEDYVRSNAADALGEIGDRSALPGLLEALKESTDLTVIRAIGDIGDPAMIKYLAPLLNSSDKDIAEFAGVALGKIGDNSAIPALREALKDNDLDVVSVAIRALGKIGDNSAIPALGQVLQHESDSVRVEAATALGELRDPLAVAELSKASANDPSKNVRIAALRALGEIGGSSALAALREALKDKDRTIVLVATYSIRNIGDPVMIHDLTQLLNSKDVDVIAAAKRAIKELNEKGIDK